MGIWRSSILGRGTAARALAGHDFGDLKRGLNKQQSLSRLQTTFGNEVP